MVWKLLAGFRSVESLDLVWWPIVESLVQATIVEQPDVLDDR